MPAWLSAIDETSSFCKEDVISGSVYYPGAGIDYSIINAYSGFAHSFIYADYGVEKGEILERIQNLAGYEVVLIKELRHKDIVIDNLEELELIE
ncbi:MAG: hypothetical protein EB015_22055, partial [Methylocystaceae bacterium]|nr:hypothetical protein [Methylocystaceae bacterium]